MTSDNDSRNIKPRSSVPASAEDIFQGAPEGTLKTETASNLVGLRSAHFKKVVREGLNETITSETSISTLAKVYARVRATPSVLSDKNFTTDAGRDGLLDLIDYLEDPADPPNEARIKKENFQTDKIYSGSALAHLSRFPLESIQSVVTSPPYWGMRMYSEEFDVSWSDGSEVPFGAEQTPEEYISHTLEFFLRLKSILEDSATVWWNIGDVYNTRTEIRETSMDRKEAVVNNEERSWADLNAKRDSYGHEYLKDKDLTLIPYRVAQGLQRSGYYVRSIITWRKEKVVPETVSDRPTTGHEVLLLISKSKQYQFDENRWRQERRESFGAPSQYENEDLRTVWELDRVKGEISDKEGQVASEIGEIIEYLSEGRNKNPAAESNPEGFTDDLTDRLKSLLLTLADERENIHQGVLDPTDIGGSSMDTDLEDESKGEAFAQDIMTGSPPVWSMPTADGRYQHAAPFPVQLPARCVLLSASSDSEKEIIYDPFIGSGTTSIAVENIKLRDDSYNLSWVGSEIVPEYQELAEKRIKRMQDESDPDEWIGFDQATFTDFS